MVKIQQAFAVLRIIFSLLRIKHSLSVSLKWPAYWSKLQTQIVGQKQVAKINSANQQIDQNFRTIQHQKVHSGEWPSCTNSVAPAVAPCSLILCLLRVILKLKASPQMSHMYGVSPVWTVICSTRERSLMYVRLHKPHLCVFATGCDFLCTARLSLVGNNLVHVWHLWSECCWMGTAFPGIFPTLRGTLRSSMLTTEWGTPQK